MKYPDKLELQLLESTHPDFDKSLPALNEIDLLVSGGYKLKGAIRQFLPQRPGEEAEVYEQRLGKFTYLNILGSAINDQVSRLSNSALVVSNAEGNFWEGFRESVNLAGKSEKNFVADLFRELLKFKKAYIHVDKSKAEVDPVNKAQEEALNLRPYLTTYSATQVINWSESKGQPQWIKVRQILDDTSNPLLPLRKKAIWTFIDNQYIARYSAYVELDKYGQISKIGDELATPESGIYLDGKVIAHGLGTIPVLKVELPDDLWIADQAAAKALEHLRTDHAKYDLLTLAYFQRTYKRIQTPDTEVDQSFVNAENEPLPTGLQHLLELDKFEWNEPQGFILPHLMDSLRQIESQVKELVSLGGFSAELGAVTQSGESKKLDFVKQDVVLKSFGEILTDAYQDILQLVAKSAGKPSENLSVSGLDDFENDSADSRLEKLDKMAKIDFDKLKRELPHTAFKLIYNQLIKQLSGNLSAQQEQEISKEVDYILALPLPSTPVEV